MKINKNLFFEIQSNFIDIPFNQTEEWLLSNYGKSLNQIVYFVDNINNPKICCWGIVFNRKLIGEHLIIDGECLISDVSIKQLKVFYEELINLGFSIIDISSIHFYNVNYEVGIRRSGFIRPLGFSLSPLTILLKLQNDFKFHRNWRRNVKKAIAENISYKYIINPSKQDTRNFIELFNKLKERKNLGYKLKIEDVMKLLNSEKYKLFFAFNKLGSPIAGRIIYDYNKKAYDLYAANSKEALLLGAVYYLQEEIFNFLRDNNIEDFDYGRIPPGKDEMDSIYVAKSYSNGTPISYNGQWQYSKFKILTFIICFNNFYKNKRKRY